MSFLEKFNPFNHIMSSRFAPHSVTLKTSFKDKLGNALLALHGSYQGGSLLYPAPKYKAGLLDYATLFLDPLLCLARSKLDGVYLNESLSRPTRYLAQGLNLVLFVPHIIIQLSLFAVSIMITLVTSFVTAIVHGFSKLAKKSLKDEARKIEISSNPQNLTIELEKANITKDANGSYQLIFKGTHVQRSAATISIGNEYETAPVALNQLSAPQTQQEKSAAALVKLNKYKVAELMEEIIDSKHSEGESTRYSKITW